MRVVVWLTSLAALVATSAEAGEWNLYTPCGELRLTSEQVRDYARERFCEPEALSELHRAFGAPPLSRVARSGRAVRISAVDDDGRRLVAIDAMQHGGRTFAIVRGEADGRGRPTIRSGLSASAWNYIAQGASRLEKARALAPIHRGCRGGLSILVETYGFGLARTVRGKDCDGGAAFTYGRAVGDLVLAAASRNCRGSGGGALSFSRLKACVED